MDTVTEAQMTRPGPRATREIWVRIPRTMLPPLAALAREHGTSRTRVIVRAVTLYLEEHTDWRSHELEPLP